MPVPIRRARAVAFDSQRNLKCSVRPSAGQIKISGGVRALAEVAESLGVRAVRWLRTTAEEGMPCYPMFRDDPLLKNLRGDPGYDRLLEEMRRDWERRRSVN